MYAVDDNLVFDGITDSIPASSGLAAIPGRPRVMDVDQDGFPDVVVTLNYLDNSQATATKISNSAIILN